MYVLCMAFEKKSIGISLYCSYLVGIFVSVALHQHLQSYELETWSTETCLPTFVNKFISKDDIIRGVSSQMWKIISVYRINIVCINRM